MKELLSKGDQAMSKLSIRQKIWMGFGVLLGVLLAVGVIAYTSMKSNKDQLSALVKDVQPAVMQSLNLVDQLDRASASLGFYLLSKEDVHKTDYLANMDKISESIARLAEMQVIKQDPQTTQLVAEVAEEITQLHGYKERMLVYATNEMENIPALKFASQEVNPRVLVLLQNLQEMITSEESQKASQARRKLFADIYSLRTSLGSAVNELRLFLALRQQNTVDNFQNYVEVVKKDFARLNTYGEDILTFEQVEARENFSQVYKEYFPLANELIKIHGAEDWRRDAYTIRKEISPLVLKIQSRLNDLVTQQTGNAVASAESLTAQVNRTQLVVGGLIVFGVLMAGLIGVILVRAITHPIDALKSSAAELAHGNLDQEIDTKRADELGSLAQSFAEMRDSIKKKIDDLRVLNVTGEIMAGMHVPMDVLEKALMVMRGQTDVEWGSVYLFNKENCLLEVATYHPKRYGETGSKARAFKIGEGIAGRAAEARHIIHIPDTSRDPSFEIKPGDDASARAIICVPMIDNDEVFGVMNFCGKVGTVKFEDADVEFAETIARMAVVSFKNINMLNVIEEQNRTLEQKVEERTAELRQKTNDINNMLQNMHQGIFTITQDGNVHPEYSAYLETILDTKEIANQKVMNLLFSNTNLGSNAIDQICNGLKAMLGEDEMTFDFNKHCLVREYNKQMADGKEKILELDWDPLLDENSNIEKLMVTVRDVTELRGLQAEAEKQKWELEVIGQILAVSANKFVAFAKDANRLLNESEQIIQTTDKPSGDEIALLFRNMHTVKGNARTYNLSGVTDAAHEAESAYDKLRKDPAMAWDKAAALAELYHVRELVQTYEVIYKEKLSSSDSDGVFVDKQLIDKLKATLTSVNDKDVNKLRDVVSKVRTITTAIGTESITGLLDAIVKSMPDLAKRLGKEAPNIVIKDNDIRLVPDVVPVIKNVFTHSFRNSVDHGIETPEERKSMGKSEKGTITLEVKEEQGRVVLSLSDDGRGLATSKLKKKAVEKGLFKEDEQVTDKMLAELIFHSGLSTAESVTEVSGRGVGMDAIRKFVEKLGGTVEVHFKGKSGKDGDYVQFESRIILPAEHSVKVA